MFRKKFNIKVPNDIKKISDIFKKNGYKLYIVGGAIRDSLLGNTIKDYDLVTDAKPDEVEDLLQSNGYKTIPIGKKFGIITVVTNNDEYEIATLRKDIGKGRRPDRVEFSDIDDDANRRDLTINALYYDIDTGEIIDLVGGLDDIKTSTVRTVGKPENRFEEDKLRVLRAIRFASRFGSKLHSDIDKYLSKLPTPDDISKERIRDEFLKAIKTAKSVKYLIELINKYKLWNWIFDGIDNINSTPIEERNPIVLIAWLLYNNDPYELYDKLNKLAYTRNEIRDITYLISLKYFKPEKVVDYKKVEKLINLQKEDILRFAKFSGLDVNLISKLLDFKLTITGKDALKAGVKKGEEIGNYIKQKEVENFNKFLSNG